MNLRSLTTQGETRERSANALTPRELAQNTAEATTHMLLACLVVLAIVIYGLRDGTELYRARPLVQVVPLGVLAIVIVRRFVYGWELRRLTGLSKLEFKEDILSKLVATVQEIIDDEPEEVGRFQPLSEWFKSRKDTTDAATPSWTAPMKHFPVCPSDVVAFVQYAEQNFNGQLSESHWLSSDVEKFVFPIKKDEISQPLMRKMQKGMAEWGYAWKSGGAWKLRESAEVIAAHVKDRTSL